MTPAILVAREAQERRPPADATVERPRPRDDGPLVKAIARGYRWQRLLESGDYAIFVLIVLFTVVLPVGKLAVAWLAWAWLSVDDIRVRRLLVWIEAIGRWSMLDVFVAAMLVVIKLSLISDVEIHAGLYVFIAAVILSMIAVRRIATLAHRRLE